MPDKQRTQPLPSEFPYIDMRLIFIALFVVLGILVFVGAPQKGVDVPWSARVMLGLCLVCVFASFRNAGKNVFALRNSHIEIPGDIRISYESITKATVTNRSAVLLYKDETGRERKSTITFGNIRLSIKKEAKPALTERLRQHGISVTSS